MIEFELEDNEDWAVSWSYLKEQAALHKQSKIITDFLVGLEPELLKELAEDKDDFLPS